jgi:hypothetical protein
MYWYGCVLVVMKYAFNCDGGDPNVNECELRHPLFYDPALIYVRLPHSYLSQSEGRQLLLSNSGHSYLNMVVLLPPLGGTSGTSASAFAVAFE